jgi:hypothetical protein
MFFEKYIGLRLFACWCQGRVFYFGIFWGAPSGGGASGGFLITDKC